MKKILIYEVFQVKKNNVAVPFFPMNCPYDCDSFEDCPMRGMILACKRSNVNNAGFIFQGCAWVEGTCTAFFSDVMKKKKDITVTVRPYPVESRACILHDPGNERA